MVAAAGPSLPPDVAATTFEAASTAFVDAMNSGFWLSFAVMAAGATAAVFLLPKKARTDQVERLEVPDTPADLLQPATN